MNAFINILKIKSMVGKKKTRPNAVNAAVSLKTRWKSDNMVLMRVMSEDSHKQWFINDELFSLSLQATLQHSKTYKKGVSNKNKLEFQRDLKRRLENYSRKYSNPVSENQHIENIEMLAKEVSSAFADCLYRNIFRIGSAQKALNLYLKYLWTIGRIKMPPHCQVDSVVINLLPPSKRRQWTRMNKIQEYRELIAALKEEANGEDLALWELRNYNKNRIEG